MCKFTIQPFEGGYVLTFHAPGNPCAFFATLADALAAVEE